MIVFFFKQKTAYEVRISDWSSDVCSSDLQGHGRARQCPCHLSGAGPACRGDEPVPVRPSGRRLACLRPRAALRGRISDRSEEHTSELQSLMRLSYAVFCLKKKK